MLRVLHLAGTNSDFQSRRTQHAVAAAAGNDVVITRRRIGRGGDYRSWHFAMADRSLRTFDVVHALDEIALHAAVRATAIVFSPSAIPDMPTVRRLARMTLGRTLHVVCQSSAEVGAYVQHGVSPERCHLFSPALDFAAIGARDDAKRLALGFAADDMVFLLPGESTRADGHREAMWAASILHVLHPNCRVLLWGRGSETFTLQRLSQKLHQPGLLTIAEEKLGREVEFEELPAVADLAVIAPHGPIPLLPIAMCMSAGLPIVATPSPWLTDLLRDGQNASIVERRAARLLAQRLVALRDDAALRERLGSSARAEAQKRFSADNLARECVQLYHQIARGARLRVS